MPRILIAECMQEISSFNFLPSEYENFRPMCPLDDAVTFEPAVMTYSR